jgi:hypothetical protein
MERGKKSLFRRTILIETWAILVRFFSLKMIEYSTEKNLSIPQIGFTRTVGIFEINIFFNYFCKKNENGKKNTCLGFEPGPRQKRAVSRCNVT